MKSLLLSFILFFISINSWSQAPVETLIKNVTVIDVRNGKSISNQNVLIQDTKIQTISSKKIKTSKKAVVIDGSDQFLIPGLWDMHTHYFWSHIVGDPLCIANGVTGVREMWGDMDTIKYIRAQIESSNILAPDIYSSGNIIDGVPQIWPGSAGVNTVDSAVLEVKAQINSGVDFLKVYSRLTRENYMAIAKTANEFNTPFAGHVPGSISIWEAIEAGQQSMEHQYGILEACVRDQEKLNSFTGYSRYGPKFSNFLVENLDRVLLDSLTNVLAKSNSWLCPTFTVLRAMSNQDDSTKMEDKKLEYLPGFITYMWNPKNDFRLKYAKPEYFESKRKEYQVKLKMIGDMYKAGVKILAGTDYPNPFCYPGFSLHEELELFVEGGLSAADALKTATYNPALFMNKLDDYGEVAEGKTASLILLSKNPLENISNTKSIQSVFLRGKYLNRAQLDKLLADTKIMAAGMQSDGEW